MFNVFGTKFDVESDFEVRLAVARPKPRQIDRNQNFWTEMFVESFFRRQKIKRRESSETRFGKVSRRSERLNLFKT